MVHRAGIGSGSPAGNRHELGARPRRRRRSWWRRRPWRRRNVARRRRRWPKLFRRWRPRRKWRILRRRNESGRRGRRTPRCQSHAVIQRRRIATECRVASRGGCGKQAADFLATKRLARRQPAEHQPRHPTERQPRQPTEHRGRWSAPSSRRRWPSGNRQPAECRTGNGYCESAERRTGCGESPEHRRRRSPRRRKSTRCRWPTGNR